MRSSTDGASDPWVGGLVNPFSSKARRLFAGFSSVRTMAPIEARFSCLTPWLMHSSRTDWRISTRAWGSEMYWSWTLRA